MQGGFLCLETGLTRSKNNINVAIKNLSDLGISIVLFWGCGFALMFGTTVGGLLGRQGFVPDLGQAGVWTTTFLAYQAMFCGTAITILSGAVAERMRFNGYLLAAAVIASFIYPIFGHWAWNGSDQGLQLGWLGSRGFVDFAGVTVVHSFGGWASLAILFVLGARAGRFTESGAPCDIPGANLPMATLGAILLWFGWFGFNGGSTLAIDERVPRIITTTIFSGAAGLVTALAAGWIIKGRADVSLVINGSLAGLVAITGSAHAVTTLSGVLIGVGGCLAMVMLDRLMLHYRIDDAVGAVPVHLGAGIWGTLAVALFGDSEALGTGLDFWSQLKIQVTGVVVCGVWTFGIVFVLFRLINNYFHLRVSPEEEHIGLNVSEHGARTDLHDLLGAIDLLTKTGDMSLRAPVEPFTEIGQIAGRYNALMGSLEQGEAALRAAKEAAEKANQAKSTFLARMSHELRTPLNAILGYTQLMTHDKGIPEQHHESLQIVGRSGEHLLSLINDVLDMSKIEAGQEALSERNFDLQRLIEDVESLFRGRSVEKRLEMIVDVKPDVPERVVGDDGKLRQVLINLLGNAIKFTERGSVTLRIDAKHSDDRVLLLFEVEDTGPGIDESDVERLFDPFVQSDREHLNQTGTGLGLAISRQFIRLMHGDVVVESQPGRGSVFKFDVLVDRAEPGMTISREEPQRRVTGLEPGQSPCRILIVDDQPESRRLLRTLLEPVGFDVREAANGREALDMWVEWPPHLIWMDLRMPVLGGLETAKIMKNAPQGQSTVIIALTASVFEEERTEVLAAGCDDFMRKPFTESEIFAAIEHHLDVRFIYGEQTTTRQVSLSRELLAECPTTWLAALHDAAVRADAEVITDLLKEIESEHAEISLLVTELVDDFRFDELASLSQ